MKIIRIDNASYYSAVFGIFISSLVLLVGIISKLLLPFALGSVFLIVSVYFINRYRKYRLELTKGQLKEMIGQKVEEVDFKEVKQLDCEIVDSGKTRSLYPIFHLLKTDGEEIKYKVHDQAALFDIATWVRINYPRASFTKNVENYINKPRANWFGGSRKS